MRGRGGLLFLWGGRVSSTRTIHSGPTGTLDDIYCGSFRTFPLLFKTRERQP